MKRLLLILTIAPLLSACASRYCERSEQVYEQVVEQAPLQSPEGLQVPRPDPNFAIPEATGEDVKYSTPITAGSQRSNCLDEPPALPAAAAPPPVNEPSPERPAEAPVPASNEP